VVKLVVDTSVVIAILSHESDGEAWLARLVAASSRCISSVNALETRIVLEMGKRIDPQRFDELRTRWSIEIVPLDETLSDLAFEAYRRFGKGRHPAKLNLGDCAAYALATSRGWPLMFKGDDFSQTDVERA
jgi:ribonuclease VapC